ncbi:osteopontin isoform 2-T2 [Spinachia spinachia]
MKVAVVFVLLFATVLCRPAGKVSVSSSESAEEGNRRPAAEPLSQKAAEAPQYREAPAQNDAVAGGSDESTVGSDEDEAAAGALTDPTSSPDTDSDNQDSEDSDDDDDDDDDAEERETEEDDTSESSESGESSTPAPATVEPVTDDSVFEFTAEPILPTVVTDTDTARGDSLGAYPGDHKSIVYEEEKSYHKVPAPYKSYEFFGTGKKMAYDMAEGNEVDKSLKVYKALQVHNDFLEEDTSTPEVESLDASQDQDVSPRQASLPEEEESTGPAAPSESESSSTPEEEEKEEGKQNESAASASTSQESEASQSNEETPGADSDSDESAGSDSDEEGAGLDTTTDLPAVLTAK